MHTLSFAVVLIEGKDVISAYPKTVPGPVWMRWLTASRNDFENQSRKLPAFIQPDLLTPCMALAGLFSVHCKYRFTPLCIIYGGSLVPSTETQHCYVLPT